MSEVIVVNEKDEVLGTMLKSEAHQNGTLHRIAVVYVENSNGDILIQKRADGYLDHFSAGHVEIGESYEEAAYRELSEELGIKEVKLKYVGHGMTRNEIYPGAKKSSHVFDIFSCVADPGKLQTNEVSSVYWAKPQDILLDMKENVNNHKYCVGFIESLQIFLNRNK